MFSIDIEKSRYPGKYINHTEHCYGTNRMSIFLEMLASTGCENAVIPILCSSEEASTFLNMFFGLVFIDGDHGYEPCLFDITTWGNKLVPGGIILVHDYHPEIDDDPVAKVVHEALRDNDLWKHLETIGSMTVWQKAKMNINIGKGIYGSSSCYH